VNEIETTLQIPLTFDTNRRLSEAAERLGKSRFKLIDQAIEDFLRPSAFTLSYDKTTETLSYREGHEWRELRS
jgi:predicted transcriptional regulator